MDTAMDTALNTTTLLLTTDTERQARDILRLLQAAEENGELDFVFNAKLGKVTERHDFDCL